DPAALSDGSDTPPGSAPVPQRLRLALTARGLPATALAVWLILFCGAFLSASSFVTSLGGDFASFITPTAPPSQLASVRRALALGLADPQCYDSLFIGQYKGFTNLLVPGGDSAPPQNGNMLFLWDPHSPLLPLLAADRVVSDREMAPEGHSSADLPVGDAGH